MSQDIDQLPPTQQAALRDALHHAPLILRARGYTAEEGGRDDHPIRTVRALVRAGLLEEFGSRVQLTEEGRQIATGAHP